MSAPQYLAQIGPTPAQATPNPVDFGSPITILAAVVFGSWLMTKRKDAQAHDIIVTTVSDAKAREQDSGQRLDKAFLLIETLSNSDSENKRRLDESQRIQLQQAGELGELRAAVAELRQALAEERAQNAQLRERLTACEAEKLTERSGRIAAEGREQDLRERLATSDARLMALKDAIASERGAIPDDDGVPPLDLNTQ
jgi:hypothetical protein